MKPPPTGGSLVIIPGGRLRLLLVIFTCSVRLAEVIRTRTRTRTCRQEVEESSARPSPASPFRFGDRLGSAIDNHAPTAVRVMRSGKKKVWRHVPGRPSSVGSSYLVGQAEMRVPLALYPQPRRVIGGDGNAKKINHPPPNNRTAPRLELLRRSRREAGPYECHEIVDPDCPNDSSSGPESRPDPSGRAPLRKG